MALKSIVVPSPPVTPWIRNTSDGLPPSLIRGSPAPEPSKPKVFIHCVRHAEVSLTSIHAFTANLCQALHNIWKRCNIKPCRIRDPRLTPEGETQCQRLMKNFPYMDKITHILCSPMHRTMQTAQIAFQPLFERGLKIEPWAELKERGSMSTINRSRRTSQLKGQFKNLPEYWDDLDEKWYQWRHHETWNTEGQTSMTQSIIANLHQCAQAALQERDATTSMEDLPILVVSHGGLLRNSVREGKQSQNFYQSNIKH